ncbi:MAG: TetR/AcrR family transcriptional regulator [Zoogloeaceae bacterium]|nr:TetR/AcrR family transcriptional regulator [Zoogloeaceae bacterium]
MSTPILPRRRPGRPPRLDSSGQDGRERLLRAGLELLTERAFHSVGLEELLGRAGVPRGSFYHYYASKDDFGLEAVDAYGRYFAARLDRRLLAPGRSPLDRLADFVADAEAGMARHGFRRGCLIGNLGQEMGGLADDFRLRIEAVFQDWEARLADCLSAAVAAGQLAPETDCPRWAHLFWIGWEGAVLRARLVRNGAPLRLFFETFLAALPRPPSFPAEETPCSTPS